jgi:S1-C subfamily serine protease
MIIQSLVLFLLSFIAHPKTPVPTYPAPALSQEILEQTKAFTVLISIEGFGGGYRGTGVLIDSTHVLTCAHMLHSDEFWIYTYPLGRIRIAHPIYASQGRDLAILELMQPVYLKHYAVFNSTTTIGQPVVVVGNTLGAMKWFVSYGMISEKEYFYDITTALIRGGNSGGPWVNLNGDVVAITDWGLVDTKGNEEDIGGGINGETIENFIKGWKSPNVLEILLGG